MGVSQRNDINAACWGWISRLVKKLHGALEGLHHLLVCPRRVSWTRRANSLPVPASNLQYCFFFSRSVSRSWTYCVRVCSLSSVSVRPFTYEPIPIMLTVSPHARCRGQMRQKPRH
jgi:hypothetical protein